MCVEGGEWVTWARGDGAGRAADGLDVVGREKAGLRTTSRFGA